MGSIQLGYKEVFVAPGQLIIVPNSIYCLYTIDPNTMIVCPQFSNFTGECTQRFQPIEKKPGVMTKPYECWVLGKTEPEEVI